MQPGANQHSPEILTVAEAARYLRLSERKLYGLVQERRIPHLRIDGRLLFPRRLLDGWLMTHLEGPAPPPSPPPVLAGSHDPLLEWASRESGSQLALLVGGSGDGLRRLAEGAAVAAGLHIREPGGGWNVTAVQGLGIADVVLVAWAERRQGLLVPPGNPAGIGGIADLARPGLRVARRQFDAGAAILLRQLLAEAGLETSAIGWVGEVCRTHQEMAEAILDGTADVGLALEAAARRFRLGFVPITSERYDLALRRRDYFEPPFQALLAFARTEPFQAHAAALGGYAIEALGEIRFNGPG
jgi:excisionase family DNA binding protein